MKRNWSLSAGAVALVVLAACSDDRTTGPAGQDAFARYVAIGTSLSMGVQSDGVVYFSQQQDWTKLLTHQAFAQYTQPLVAPPGCFSPLIAPLQLSRRLSGISAAASQTTSIADTACTSFGAVTLPANDVAIDGANTYDALYVTPETASVEGVKRRRQYRLVLPPKNSQVTAMMQQKLAALGVDWRLGTSVTSIDGNGDGLRLTLANGDTLDVDAVLSAVAEAERMEGRAPSAVKLVARMTSRTSPVAIRCTSWARSCAPASWRARRRCSTTSRAPRCR